MNHIRIYHINYYILFRHQSGRRPSYEFESAVKRLVRMSRIFFVSAIFGFFHFFRGGVGWGEDRAGDAGAAPQRRQRARGPAPAPCRYLYIYVCIYVFMYVCIYVFMYVFMYLCIYYIILYHIISYIISYIIYYTI